MGTVAAAAVLGIACGNNGQTNTLPPTNFHDAEVPPHDSAIPQLFDAIGILDVSIVTGSLSVVPASETIDVPPTKTVQFHAYQGDAGETVAASWSVDQAAIGTIDQTGLFTATGAVGGTVNVFAQSGQDVGKATLTVRVHITDLPAGYDAGVLSLFAEGGTADPNFVWLYPYDQTVFPRGLNAPRLQWAGTTPSLLYVTASSQNLDYKGVFAPTNSDGLSPAPPQLDLPNDAWQAITLSAGAADPVAISVTKLDVDSGVTGPINETWTIAQGTLKGLVYYNTYDSPLAQGDSGSQNDMGAVMRLRPGATLPEVFVGGSAKGSCTVCHTLSANGSTMSLSAGHAYDAIYSVSADASSPIGPLVTAPDNTFSFSALTPDGKYLLSCGSTGLDAGTDDAGPVSIGDYGPNVVSMTSELDSRLFATADGGVVGSIPGVTKAVTPAFSPDGTKLAFNRYEPLQDQRLSVVSFDESTLTFGTYADVFVDPGFYLSWPSFLPDSKEFLFMVSSDTDQYSTYQQYTYNDANGELLLYNPAVNDVFHQREAMGQTKITLEDGGTESFIYLRNPDGTTATEDRYKNYEPTALPVAAAGYYWVVFTSRRSYGNTIDNSNPNAPPANSPKKLWVTAIDINGVPDTDWSHPAFYLPGQELASGNIRAFWTLPPCEGVGASCQSGTDCCNGFCRQVPGDAGPTFACVPPPSGCSNVDEKCTASSDCCNSSELGILCINGFCALPTPR